MKKCYLKNMDKPIGFINKIIKVKIKGENGIIYSNLNKEKNIKKVIKKIMKNEITHVILSKELTKNKSLITALNANQIKIFDGKELVKYLSIDILDYIIDKKRINKEEIEIAITTNEINDLSIETIKILAKQYKKLTVVTNYIQKLKKLENEIFERDGVIIVVSNNQKKCLQRAQIILNMDFNKEILNKYRISEKAIIVNLEGNMMIDSKRFNGIVINDYEIIVGKEDLIWIDDMEKYEKKDILESIIYLKDTYKNITTKIKSSKVKIKDLYGINGKIERF